MQQQHWHRQQQQRLIQLYSCNTQDLHTKYAQAYVVVTHTLSLKKRPTFDLL